MSNSKHLNPKHRAVCGNPWLHGFGRRPYAPYLVNGEPHCRDCLEAHLRQRPTLASMPIRPPGEPSPPGWCVRRHLPSAPAAYLLEGEPLCWECIDATLRAGGSLTLDTLQPRPKVVDYWAQPSQPTDSS